jgi:hypothetical protein
MQQSAFQLMLRQSPPAGAAHQTLLGLPLLRCTAVPSLCPSVAGDDLLQSGLLLLRGTAAGCWPGAQAQTRQSAAAGDLLSQAGGPAPGAVLGAGELTKGDSSIWSILEGFCDLPALVLIKDAAAGESALVMPVRLIRCVAWHMSCSSLPEKSLSGCRCFLSKLMCWCLRVP